MNLAPTSDLPSTSIQAVFDMMCSVAPLHIAWIPPFTAQGRQRFPVARDLFASFGILDTVRLYSERVSQDMIALAHGAAMLHTQGDDFSCVGQALRFHRGVCTPIK